MSYTSSERRENVAAAELTVASHVHTVVLCDLAAGTQYHVNVTASTPHGHGPAAGLNTWTEIGMPDKPPRPRVNSTGPGTITVLIQPAVLTQGPLSAYFFVISTPTSNNASTGRPRRDNPANPLPDPVVHIPLPGLTVAQLADDDIQLARYFTVGDGQIYGGYKNTPLTAGIMYTVHYVVASWLDGRVKMNYASTDRPVAPGSEAVTTAEQQWPSAETVIVMAVLIPLLLLVLLALTVYVVYYYCCSKYRHQATTSSQRPAGSTRNASWLKYYTGNQR